MLRLVHSQVPDSHAGIPSPRITRTSASVCKESDQLLGQEVSQPAQYRQENTFEMEKCVLPRGPSNKNHRRLPSELKEDRNADPNSTIGCKYS